MRKRTRKRNLNKFKINNVSFLNIIKNKKIKSIFIMLLIVIILGFFSVIFAVINIPNTKIIHGIYINNMDVSNKSKDEVKTQFEDILNKKIYDSIKIKHNDNTYNLELGLLNIETNLNKILEEAEKVGRSGNVIKDNYEIIKTFFTKKDFYLSLKYDEKNLMNEINCIYNELPDKYKELDYYIEAEELILTKPVTGIIIKNKDMIKEIESYLNNYLSTENIIILPYELKSAEDIEISELYKNVYVEAKNAYYDKEPFKIYPEIVGVDFAISNEEINSILKNENEKNEYIIPLKISSPQITLANLSIDVFPNIIAKADGNYDVTNYNRANNLILAGQKINEYVISPGEIFSYNKVVGARTIDAGYKEAAIYVGGKIKNGLGGGICQISSILYNAVLKANLEIVERKSHQFLPSYAKPRTRCNCSIWNNRF